MHGHRSEQAVQRGPVHHLGARNDAEAKTRRAIPWHGVMERFRITCSMKI